MARPTSRLLQVGVLLASVLALCAVVWGPSALAGSSVGSFEIDGNLVDSPPGEPIDWSTPPPNLTNFNDLPSGRNDTSFGQGSKELEPGGWTCGTGGVPGKDNIVSGQVAFRTFDDPNDVPDAGPKQFAYVNFTRGAVNGDAHMDFEFNQSDDPNPADACQDVPIRTDGDLLITFDTENGGATIIVRLFEWNGDSVSGTFDPVPLGANADGAVNIPNTIPGHQAGDFGEAAINLTDTIGEIACGEFAVAYMKTRASTSINAALKDRTAPQAINVGNCPNSDLDKGVRNVPDPDDQGPFAASVTASPGDTIEYQLIYTNNGTADAHNVTITEEVPEHSTFLSCTGGCTNTGTTPGSTITWQLGTVAPDDPQTVTFRTQLDSSFPPGQTTIENVANVTTDEEPPPGKDSNPTEVVVTAFAFACTGHAFDLRLDLTGVLSQFAGPAIKTDPNVFPDKETFSSLALTVPGDTNPVATAVTLEAENSGDPETGCKTRITYEDLFVDLNNLDGAPDIPITLSVKAIESIATATQDTPVSTSTDVTILNGVLTVGADTFELPVKPDPNTTIVDQTVGPLTVKVVLHETTAIPNGVAVNAIRVQVALNNPITGDSLQTVDLKVAHAEADVEGGS